MSAGFLWMQENQVLIDTWWNVNVPEPPYMYITFIVLIDTWWNVNLANMLLLVFVNPF